MQEPDACKYWAGKLPQSYQRLSIDSEPGDRACRVDYLSRRFVSYMEDTVDCEQKCDDFIDDGLEEGEVADTKYEDCVKNCHDMIKEYGKGSIRYRETGEVIDANIPMTINPFLTNNQYGESILMPNWEKKVLKKFEKIGCEPDSDIGFRHPHEFAETTAGTEPEEDPAAFALHFRGSKGGCFLDDVSALLKKLGET